jgi:protocatechuate 3,4-dioxygenase beta subunit
MQSHSVPTHPADAGADSTCDIHADDIPVGRVLSRREVLSFFGFAGASSLLAACQPLGTGMGAERATVVAIGQSPAAQATLTAEAAAAAAANAQAAGEVVAAPACIARPANSQGPFFFDVRLDRSDIRADPATGVVKAGAPLALTFRVSQVTANACTPLAGAVVDVWHCDADGLYSGVADRRADTSAAAFLRGYQRTDAGGTAAFTTIYPGWYPGRTIHIHFKIRTDPDAPQGYDFTSQLYFDETINDQVMALPPYNTRGPRSTLNAQDGLFVDQLLVPVTPAANGYAAVFDIGLDLS